MNRFYSFINIIVVKFIIFYINLLDFTIWWENIHKKRFFLQLFVTMSFHSDSNWANSLGMRSQEANPSGRQSSSVHSVPIGPPQMSTREEATGAGIGLSTSSKRIQKCHNKLTTGIAVNGTGTSPKSSPGFGNGAWGAFFLGLPDWREKLRFQRRSKSCTLPTWTWRCFLRLPFRRHVLAQNGHTKGVRPWPWSKCRDLCSNRLDLKRNAFWHCSHLWGRASDDEEEVEKRRRLSENFIFELNFASSAIFWSQGFGRILIKFERSKKGRCHKERRDFWRIKILAYAVFAPTLIILHESLHFGQHFCRSLVKV